MMIQQMPLTYLLAAIQQRIEGMTGRKCYDAVPVDAKSPFYYMELIKTDPGKIKNMYRTECIIWVHSIAEKTDSKVPVLKYVKELAQAMSDDVAIPAPYELHIQTDRGLIDLKQDETGEWHAVSEYEFVITYGWQERKT